MCFAGILVVSVLLLQDFPSQDEEDDIEEEDFDQP
jgi:hypothetical protein